MRKTHYATETPPRDLATNDPLLHSRRVVVRAAAILGAWIVAGGPTILSSRTTAQEAPQTLAVDWDPASNVSVASDDGFTTLETSFPISAVGASWNNAVGTWPVIEIQLSLDGELYTGSFLLSTISMLANRRPMIDFILRWCSLVGPASSASIAQSIQKESGSVDGFVLTYVNTFDGPTRFDTSIWLVATDDPLPPPPIVSRADWGANESLSFQ